MAERTDGEREALPGRKVRREDPVLGVVERAVADSGDDLADDEQRVAVEVVRRRAGHDDGAREVEAGEDDGHDRASPFVDVEAEPNAEERVHEVRDCDLC